MSSADAQVVFNQGGFSEPSQARDQFAQQFGLDNPDKAMSSYQRVMHQHTKQQFEVASASSRRRSTKSDADMASLSTETSRGSVSSVAS